MTPYPQQQIPDVWSTVGQGLSQAGQQIGDYSDKQDKLRQLFEEMQQKKAAALLAARAEEDKHAAAVLDAQKKAKDEAAQTGIENYAQGIVSPTLAANPSLSRSNQAPITPGGPTQAELDDLSNVDGIPTQSVTSGDNATAMMGKALDAMPAADMANGKTTKPTRDELIQRMGETGVLAGKDYAAATDPYKNMDPMTRAMMTTQGKMTATKSPARGAFLKSIADLETKNKGKTLLKADILQAALDADSTGSIFDDPAYQKTIEAHATQPATSGSRLVGSYLTDFRHVKDAYEKVAQPYLAFEGVKNSKAYGTGVGDQSMIDKLLIMETGKVPTEAQYAEMAKNWGYADLLDKVSGKIKSGQKIPQATRDAMESEARQQMKIAHDGYDESLKEQADIMTAGGVAPEKVIRKGGYYSQVEKMKPRWNEESPGTAVTRITTQAEFDSLPSGAHYIGPSGHLAVKP